MRCSKCGTELSQDVSICPACNEPIKKDDKVTEDERNIAKDAIELTENDSPNTAEGQSASANVDVEVDATSSCPDELEEQITKDSDNSGNVSEGDAETKEDAHVQSDSDIPSDSDDSPQFKRAKPQVDITEKAKGVWSRIPKKLLAIIAGAIVVACVAVGVFSAMASRPLEMNDALEIDDVIFDYPAGWKEGEAKEGDIATLFSPDGKGEIGLNCDMCRGRTAQEIAESWEKDGYTLSQGTTGTLQASDHPTYIAELTRTSDKASGYIFVTTLGHRFVRCSTLALPGAPASYKPTFKLMVENARMADVSEEYTVTFMDGDVELHKEVVIDSGGGAMCIPPKNPTKPGYLFTKWELVDETANVDIYKEPSGDYAIGGIKEDLVFQAQWEKAWTVTFTDGQGGILKTETVANGKDATAPNTPTRNGFTFKGWNQKFSNVTGDLTIDAQWSKKPTVSEKNALASAQSYLKHMAFSYTGLIEQLEFEKYSHADAVYAADNCGANWYEQAAKSAKSYMKYMSFSRAGLIDQLEFEGFTYDQAVYGADAVGL